MVQGIGSASGAQGAVPGPKVDTTKFTRKPENGGTSITWEREGRKTVHFWLGQPKSGEIKIAGRKATPKAIDALVKTLVSEFGNADATYGSSDAADRYQEILELVAKTLGKSLSDFRWDYRQEIRSRD